MKRGYPVSKGILSQMQLFIHVFYILFTIIHRNTYLEKGLFFLARQKENGGGAVKRKNAGRCAVTGAGRPPAQRDAALNRSAQ